MTSKTTRPRRKRSSSPATPPEPIGHDLFDYGDVDRRLHGDQLTATGGNDESNAHARQRALWQRLYDDERGAWRSLLVPDAAMLARIAALDQTCPQFSEVTAWILRAATLALAGGQALRLDPCVMLGAPGVGKTYYARKLAQVFGVATLNIPMNLVTDRGTWFSGLAPVWRASAPGKVAQILLDSSCASPVTLPLGIAHFTTIDVPPLDFVALAAKVGFSSIGLRLHPAFQGAPLTPNSATTLLCAAWSGQER